MLVRCFLGQELLKFSYSLFKLLSFLPFLLCFLFVLFDDLQKIIDLMFGLGDLLLSFFVELFDSTLSLPFGLC
jgi:hypothetical protein